MAERMVGLTQIRLVICKKRLKSMLKELRDAVTKTDPYMILYALCGLYGVKEGSPDPIRLHLQDVYMRLATKTGEMSHLAGVETNMDQLANLRGDVGDIIEEFVESVDSMS